MNAERSKYTQIIQHIHKKISVYVPFLLMMKVDFNENFVFFFFSYFLRFVGILIHCGNFNVNAEQVINNKSVSNWFRYITAYSLVKTSGMSNLTYVIICLIIFILFVIRLILYGTTIYKINSKKNIEKIKPYGFQIFMDQIVFLLFPFLIEFLFFSVLILSLPNDFIIKRELKYSINILVSIINIIMIIGYNINGIIYMSCVNRPLTDKKTPIKYRYSNKKFYLLFLMQNLTLIQSTELYLTGDALKIFKLIIFIVLASIFIGLFFTSLTKFNYPTKLNYFVDIMANFCFFSIIIEAILYLLKYNITRNSTLFFFTLIKIVIAICFQYMSNNLNINLLLKYAKIELFKINKEIENELIYDIFLFVYDMMKNVKNSKGDASSQNLLNIVFLHQSECQQMNCKCKLIQMIPYGENYEKNFIPNLIERFSFLVESAFVQIDYSNDYDLTLLLCEHYCYFKNNPIMAYSMVQTLLHFNCDKLGMSQLIQLYEVADKYIEVSLNMAELQLTKDINLGNKAGFNQLLKENKFKEIFFMLNKVKKIQKIMFQYSQNEITMIKYKEMVEESVKIHKDEETGDVKKITTTFLTSANIGKIIKLLECEVKIYKDLFNYIEQLNGQKLPIEFYYKCFLFAELFWGGKITEQIVPTMYSFTNDRNMYSTNLNPSVYVILRQRYIDLNLQGNSTYNAIFKYTKGMCISYYSEPLANRLGFHQSDVSGQSIDVLLPKDLSAPHSTAVLRFLISQQNRVFPKIKNFMFDKINQIYNSTIYGASLPGLGKNLMILIVIELKELVNEYYFLLNKNFELMAISENFEKNYALSMPLIEKFGINLLDCFEINLGGLRVDFQEDIKKILTLKHNMEIMTGEYFTKRLFRQNAKIAGKHNLNKFKLLDELEKDFSDSSAVNSKFSRTLKKAQLMIEKIYNHKISEKVDCSSCHLSVPKNTVINNIVKVVNKLTEVDLHDESYKKLTESVFKFKNYNHTKEEDNNNLAKGKKNNNTYDSYFDIEARISVLYDTPFYAFKLTEITKTTPGIKNLGNTSDSEGSEVKSQAISQKVVSFTSKKSAMGTGNYSVSNNKTNTSLTKRKMVKVQNNVKNNQIECFNYIGILNFGLLSILLVIYIVIIFYQNYIINTGHNIFFGLYYNYYQRDKLLCLFSSILSAYFFSTNITSYTTNERTYMTTDSLTAIMKSYSFDFQNSFHYFYTSYIDYKKNLNEPLTALYEMRTMNKIATDWNNKVYESDYISEAEFISYIAHNAATELVGEQIAKTIKDCPYLFQSRFDKNETTRNRKVESNFIPCAYYLAKNYNSQFHYFFDELQEESEHSFIKFSGNSRKIYIMIEILGMLVYIIFFTLMFIYLYQSNSMMFKNILNMFLDFTQEGTYNFKNHVDNFILIKKISEFNLLLIDFSLGILDNYNKKISAKSALNGNLTMNLDNDMSQDGKRGKDDKDNEKSEKKKRNEKKEKKILDNNNKSKNESSRSNLMMNSTNQRNTFVKLNNSQMDSQKSMVNATSTINNQKKSDGNNNKKEEIDDVQLNTDIILEKTENKGILQISIIIYIFVFLFLVILIYFFVKIFVSLGFINDIKNIFDDFGTVSYKYSMVYYYFNTIRVLLIIPKFTTEKIFDTMTNDLIKENNNINNVLNYRMADYKSTAILFNAFSKKQGDTSVNIQQIICLDDPKCIWVLNSNAYNMLTDGVDVAINAMVQQTQNTYNDYKAIKENSTQERIDNMELSEVTDIYIDEKFKQVDVNLNFVLSLVQERIYKAFLEDAISLKDKFQNQINIFNSCAIVYCILLGLFVMIYVINKIKRMTLTVEVSTMRLNKAFCFIKENNLGNQMSSQSASFMA